MYFSSQIYDICIGTINTEMAAVFLSLQTDRLTSAASRRSKQLDSKMMWCGKSISHACSPYNKEELRLIYLYC